MINPIHHGLLRVSQRIAEHDAQFSMCLEIRPRHQTCWLGDLKAGFRGIRELCKPIKFVIQDPVIKMERVAVHCSCSRKFSPKNLSASLHYAKRLYLLEDMYETLKNLGGPRSQVFANKSPPAYIASTEFKNFRGKYGQYQ